MRPHLEEGDWSTPIPQPTPELGVELTGELVVVKPQNLEFG